jgi:hypothetical protein
VSDPVGDHGEVRLLVSEEPVAPQVFIGSAVRLDVDLEVFARSAGAAGGFGDLQAGDIGVVGVEQRGEPRVQSLQHVGLSGVAGRGSERC